MTKRTSNLILFSAILLTFALHAASLGFAPWMDEVHIVEMGRLTLGPATESILTNADGTFFTPLYYIGPCVHELAFRLFGPFGVRLLPMLALAVAAVLFRKWLRNTDSISEATALLLSLCVLWMPLFIQSTRLVRVDAAVMALAFGILALLDTPTAVGNRKRLAAAAALAAASPFLWPSAVLLFPLYAARYAVRCRAAKRPATAILADGVLGLTAFCATACLCILPIFDRLIPMIAAFSDYFGGAGAGTAVNQGTGVSLTGLCRGLAVLSVKETLRAPFFSLLVPFGLLIALVREKLTFAAFLLAFVAALASGLHTFRNIFLFPYFILFFCLVIRALEVRLPQATRIFLCLGCLYGAATGPMAYALAGASASPADDFSVETLRRKPGTGPLKVLSLDYRTYYAGRLLGWRQMAYPTPAANVTDSAGLLKRATHVILPVSDRYRAIEESHTLYGGLRNLALSRARAERTSDEPGFLARIGEAFAYDELPEAERNAIVKNLRKAHFLPSDPRERIWQRQPSTVSLALGNCGYAD